MEKNIGFKITVEFDCPDMINEKIFNDEFGGNPMEAYKFISDNFSDSPLNFSNDERVVKVELLPLKIMKKFTQEQIQMMHRAMMVRRAISLAPARQVFMWRLWEIFRPRKADKLIKCLEVGMTWFAAYTIAKNVR